ECMGDPLKRYRGVRKRGWGKCTSAIYYPKQGKQKQLWIGSFDTPEMAATAYDAVANFFHGPKARLNFPELRHTLPKFPPDATVRKIRALARGAAEGSHGGGGGSSISGVTEPIQSLEEWQIQSLEKMPIYSPLLHQTMMEDDTSGFDLYGGDTYDTSIDLWNDQMH
ncbi:hypothetical protein Csa_023806, partial [Cucumis sativus]